MTRLILAIAAMILLAAPRADLSISAKVNGSMLAIRASGRTAGAIDSVTWRGKEFLNSFDHGRELQSASSFDGYGECPKRAFVPLGDGPSEQPLPVAFSAPDHNFAMGIYSPGLPQKGTSQGRVRMLALSHQSEDSRLEHGEVECGLP